MPYIVNPGGRIVQIDEKEQFNALLKQVGFREATEQEVFEFTSKRTRIIERMQYESDLDEGGADRAVYIATVSPGGKDGYGVASFHLINELQNQGVKISTYKKDQKIGFLFHSPQALIKLENPVKLIYTMFESDKIPDEWIEYLQIADKVFVPTQWCMEVFAKSGIATEVVPLGYNDKIYKYKERYVKRDKNEPFTFIHYNAFNIRKGFLEVLKAFNKAFEKDEPVKMIFKTTLNQIPLPLPPTQYPNIEVITGAKPEEEMRDLLYRSDCFVFPSRGEGFAIPPLEAMATGLPVIVPNAHGITEYFNPEYMYEAKIKETCPAIYARYKGIDVGKMVVTDIDQLAQQMRFIYEHQEEANEVGKKASEYAKNWTFEKTAIRFKEIFDEWIAKDVPKKPNSNLLILEEVK